MQTHNYLNVFNEYRAQQLLESGGDYADMIDDKVLIVACDNTVWVCSLDGVSLNEAKLIQRII